MVSLVVDRVESFEKFSCSRVTFLSVCVTWLYNRELRVVAHYRDCGEGSLKRFLKVSVCHLWWRSCRTTCWYPQGRSVPPARGCLCAYPGRLKTSCWKEDNAVVIGSSFDNLSTTLLISIISRSLEIPRGGKRNALSRRQLRGDHRKCTSYRGHRRTRGIVARRKNRS